MTECLQQFNYVSFCSHLDLSAMDNSVFLELHGLEWDLSLYCYMYLPWSRLSNIYVYFRVQTPAARHPEAHWSPRSPGFPQSKGFFFNFFNCWSEAKLSILKALTEFHLLILSEWNDTLFTSLQKIMVFSREQLSCICPDQFPLSAKWIATLKSWGHLIQFSVSDPNLIKLDVL